MNYHRLVVIVLLMTLALVSESKSYPIWQRGPNKQILRRQMCSGLMGDCTNDNESLGLGLGSLDKERRKLASQRYISYDALKKDSIPCNNRGNSYYGCGSPQQANPYSRGCNAITRCARSTDWSLSTSPWGHLIKLEQHTNWFITAWIAPMLIVI